MDRNAEISPLVIKAFTKLKASLYYEKNNLHLRQQMVDFCSEEIGQKMDNLANRLSNGDSFDDELKKIGLFLLPKKIKSTQSDPNMLSNSFDFNKNEIERLMIYADIPIELHIVAVLWVMLFGSKLDKELDQYCWGNRLIIDEDTEEIKAGRHLFKPYPVLPNLQFGRREYQHLQCGKTTICGCRGMTALQPDGGVVGRNETLPVRIAL